MDGGGKLRFCNSRLPAAEAPETAITTVGSVLTGGVVGAMSLGKQLGHRNIIATDVGGTTFLVGVPTHAVGVHTENRECPRAALKLPLKLRSAAGIP